ncbi:pyridoxamine 5'-phosphate oxidase family protein [Yimella sp. cx-51]|uniref:pyridoxamine 5'-phosphate oxidase family protein n=1 Tax=Yimella sp. cx-51 TaxID=2770551 RepID=UPI00165E64F7|nr:pyridoxamine 5'-phosphate oxidase family protein [Yimella sp. cx-51]MBC9956228.1 pyridoxamine 5'-phosphate oxidase family protein [Yimella sp. cx-51]MBD2759674.1 pyridoxamine 5'-phosphate oxidase family protein [Yimella sp. cx-573]QTH38626.1 pyridoxamine 5'-phosphate oxidase family protein [Yimella sp. cx-51]
MTDDTFQPGEISDLECVEFLRSQELGRLAFHLLGEVHIVPINYALDSDGRIIFRTAEGSKLLAVTMNDDVAFEVDELDGERATSVVVRGRAQVLEGEAAYVADTVPLRPWLDTPKFNVVAIVPSETTGRRFQMHRPWKSMRPS